MIELCGRNSGKDFGEIGFQNKNIAGYSRAVSGAIQAAVRTLSLSPEEEERIVGTLNASGAWLLPSELSKPFTQNYVEALLAEHEKAKKNKEYLVQWHLLSLALGIAVENGIAVHDEVGQMVEQSSALVLAEIYHLEQIGLLTLANTLSASLRRKIATISALYCSNNSSANNI
jgi:hypothetical protein